MTDIKKEEKVESKKFGKRTPLHQQRAIGIKERAGYVRRLVNELPGRIERFIEAGWQPVTGNDQADHDNRLQSGKEKLGSLYRPQVNRRSDAQCTHAIWMEIPENLYNEDQADKMAEQDRKMEGLDPRNMKKSDPDKYYTASM